MKNTKYIYTFPGVGMQEKRVVYESSPEAKAPPPPEAKKGAGDAVKDVAAQADAQNLAAGLKAAAKPDVILPTDTAHSVLKAQQRYAKQDAADRAAIAANKAVQDLVLGHKPPQSEQHITTGQVEITATAPRNPVETANNSMPAAATAKPKESTVTTGRPTILKQEATAKPAKTSTVETGPIKVSR